MHPLAGVKKYSPGPGRREVPLTPIFPRDRKFILPTDLMASLLRLLVLSAVFVSASHLAVPGAGGMELELGGAWMGEPTAEPAAAVPPDPSGAAPLVDEPPLSGDMADLLEVDLWADSFLPSAGSVASAGTDPAQPYRLSRRRAVEVGLVSVVTGRPPSRRQIRLPIVVELGRRAETVVRVPAVQQLVRVGRVQVQTL